MDWEETKKEYRAKSTEDLFSISNQPDHLCPSIDSICKTIPEIESSANGGKYDSRDETERLSDIKWEVRGLEDSVEEVRKSIEGIRKWGQEWKDLAKNIIEYM